LAAGDTATKSYTLELDPAYKVENLSVVPYVLYENEAGKMAIANAVKVPVNGFAGFKYAE
jgi:hypothetical protein